MIARSIKVIFLVCLLTPLTVSVTGCGTENAGRSGCASPQEVQAEKEWDKKVQSAGTSGKAETKAGEESGTVMKSVQRPEGDPVLMWKAGNDGGIEGGGKPPTVTQDKAYFVTEVSTYHWNSGTGAPAGEITLKASGGTVYGPWKATLRNKVYWVVQPEQDIPAGTYTLIDSDPSTWAQNSGSGGTGMGWAYGIPVE